MANDGHISETEAWQRVVSVVAEVSGVDASKLTPDTRLFHDLRIAGDDVDSLDAIFSGLPVDWSGYDVGRYFPDEVESSPLGSFPHWYKPKWYQPLYLSDLANIARCGSAQIPAREVIVDHASVVWSKVWSALLLGGLIVVGLIL